MVVSFVNSGLMNLTQASGIILGANIGTTVTALLVAFRLSAIAPVLVLGGAVLMHYVRNNFLRKMGEVLLGFGMLFVGIATMSESMTSMRDMPGIASILQGFTNPFLGVLLGILITTLVQSSSVTVSILVVMGAQGLVTLDICMFVILGCNIGACTSAVLAAVGTRNEAKRAALIHLLFNVFGTIVMFVLLMLFAPQIAQIVRFFSGTQGDAGTLGRNIAFAHLLFKVFQVIVFYPFMDLLIHLTRILVPGDDAVKSEEKYRVQYIQDHRPNPAVAVLLAVEEMERMAHMAFDNLNLSMECLLTGNLEKLEQVHETELYVDYLDEQISDYLVRINQNTLPLHDAGMISAYFNVVTDIERISDHAETIAENVPRLYKNGNKLSKKSMHELEEMMTIVNVMLDESLDMFVTGNMSHMQDIRAMENQIDAMEIELTQRHIKRLREGKCSAQAGIYYTDTVSGLERVADHAMNIAFSLLEAKNGKHMPEKMLAMEDEKEKAVHTDHGSVRTGNETHLRSEEQ